MKNNPEKPDPSGDFSQLMKGIKPLKQDTVVFKRQARILAEQKKSAQGNTEKQISASFEFSDGFEAYSDSQHVISFIQADAEKSELKKLRRGDYTPDLVLDLHGLNRVQSKHELAALLHEAVKQRAYCISVMHGKGNNILRKAVPNWLIQHPSVLAFHQAPKPWGGESALLILIILPTESFEWD